VAREAARFSGTEEAPPQPAPHLGEHGEAVLRELGYEAARISALKQAGVLRLPAA
jgi:alpha-methylacyl-CoA racemase